METVRNEGREAILWLIGLPLAVIAAALTLLVLLSAVIGTDPNTRDLHISLLLVGGFGLPSALIARAMRRRRPAGWTTTRCRAPLQASSASPCSSCS